MTAGSHSGALLGSSLSTFGLSGNVSGVLHLATLFRLPFAADAEWETNDRLGRRLFGNAR